MDTSWIATLGLQDYRFTAGVFLLLAAGRPHQEQLVAAGLEDYGEGSCEGPLELLAQRHTLCRLCPGSRVLAPGAKQRGVSS